MEEWVDTPGVVWIIASVVASDCKEVPLVELAVNCVVSSGAKELLIATR